MEDSPPSLPTTRKQSPFPPPPLKVINKNNTIMSELKKSLFSPSFRGSNFRSQRSMALAYGFTFIFVSCAIFFVFNNPSLSHSSVWFKKIMNTRSQVSTFFSSYFSPNYNTSQSQNPYVFSLPFSRKTNGVFGKMNDSQNGVEVSVNQMNGSENGEKGLKGTMNQGSEKSLSNHNLQNMTHQNDKDSRNVDSGKSKEEKNQKDVKTGDENARNGVLPASEKDEPWWEIMSHCDIFDGSWVKEDANPLYEPGSCPHIDEPFDCYRNGRPDNGYEKFRWQPKHCNIPRMNAKEMLELLRGKRLVYVGDSLNRNMWESMVCLLRSSVEDKNRVFEASGKQEFKKEGAYSFIFKDYNCSVEFVRSPFLVQEWEMPDGNGSKKETLRLDLVERSSDKYEGADILVFNTGHWWTHEKTSAGKGYYQEGSHVYGELDVLEAFRRAMTTWARWIEANVDPIKTQVFFRGYSVSHFSGGEWYSGGKCDSDTEPLVDENDLSPSLYPPIMGMLDNVLKWMKTPVYYLNITRMTDFRKDAHPSVYRNPNMTAEERNLTLRYQDCSHWCLPGVPDTWNELLYAQLLMKHYQQQYKQQQQIGS